MCSVKCVTLRSMRAWVRENMLSEVCHLEVVLGYLRENVLSEVCHLEVNEGLGKGECVQCPLPWARENNTQTGRDWVSRQWGVLGHWSRQSYELLMPSSEQRKPAADTGAAAGADISCKAQTPPQNNSCHWHLPQLMVPTLNQLSSCLHTNALNSTRSY